MSKTIKLQKCWKTDFPDTRIEESTPMHMRDSIVNRGSSTLWRGVAGRIGQILALILVTVLLFACSDEGILDPVSEEVQEIEAESITPAWIQSNAGNSALARELNDVRKATQKYKDASKALYDGYVPVNYVPGMGFHFVNFALVAANHEADPVDGIENPPILVYYTTGNFNPDDVIKENGDVKDYFTNENTDWLEYLRLGAVEYAHLGDAGEPFPTGANPANYFSDEEAPRNLKVSEEEGWEPIPNPEIEDEIFFTALHVWVHRGNPDGLFAPFNPTIN
ncbi:MAG: hypothetical protein EA390_01015 [Balneolaceae bacterium]|nr:MAG: hypothetical protein EA390_01015 [Balneolaceae bacterium]